MFFLLIFFSFLSAEEPWGRDAELLFPISNICIQEKKEPFLEKFGTAAIRFHQEVISPADGPRSHFIPSSSQYTLDAIRKYGFFSGVMRGCDRLMRENDEEWIYRKVLDASGRRTLKFDPVK